MFKKNLVKFILLAIAAFTLSGCASTIMQQVEPVSLEPLSDKALVTFMRPSYFGGAIQFGIWDSENFVGVLSAGSSIQYLADPGEHVFLARAENWSYVKAELEGGKQYYIIGKVFPGIWKARVALDPVNVGDEDAEKVAMWLGKLKPTAVMPDKLEAYVTPRTEQVKAAVAEIDNGKTKFGVLYKTDGR